jgi:hypothetical protein
MNQVLIFRTGETTCSEKPAYPGSMCPFVEFVEFAAYGPVCCLFGNKRLNESDGWLQRLPECVAKFHGANEWSRAAPAGTSARSCLVRPATNGELLDRLAAGETCEVEGRAAERTAMILRGCLDFDAFTVRPSDNAGWTLFEPNAGVKR